MKGSGYWSCFQAMKSKSKFVIGLRVVLRQEAEGEFELRWLLDGGASIKQICFSDITRKPTNADSSKIKLCLLHHTHCIRALNYLWCTAADASESIKLSESLCHTKSKCMHSS
jgi:hypothetical protein